MPTFKYQAVLPTGVSIYGVFDAADRDGLHSYLLTRGMTLVEASELSINTALTTPREALPRMLQLRVGDRLREALLTDMPAHEAVRAIAEEPFEHPVLMTLPWLFFMSCAAGIALGFVSLAIPEGQASLQAFALGLPLTVAVAWIAARFWFVRRPYQMLRTIADRMERGDLDAFSGLGILPGELQAVMSSSISSRSKATSVAELVPTLTGMQVQSHQFAARILGPAIAASTMLIGIYVLLLTVVDQFNDIFLGFGIELPAPTMLIVQLSSAAQILGMAGLIGFILIVVATLAVVYTLIVSPRTAEIWESVPGLGLSVRWLMQARVARILATLIRNRVAPADAILIASKASGFSSVEESGKRIAEVLESGTPELAYTRQLSGLPLSMLFRISGGKDNEAARQETSQAFQSFAAALEQASSGNGNFIALILEILILVFSATLVGFVVIALFMPLIKLLNDLSIVVWSWS